MRSFTYLQPTSLTEALECVDAYGDDARPLAGGQSLLLEMKTRARSPRALVALSTLPELRGYGNNGDGDLVLGPVTTYRDFIDRRPPGPYRSLATVVADIADVPVRSVATVGGAICQANPRFDLPAVMVALHAELVLRSVGGERRVPAGEFFQGPGTTAMGANELMTAIRLPRRDTRFCWSFRKFRMRRMDAALVSIALSGNLDEDGLHEPAVVVAGCLDRPERLSAVESILDGQPLTHQLIDDAGRALVGGFEPVSTGWPFPGHDYLRDMARVMLARMLHDLADRPPATT